MLINAYAAEQAKQSLVPFSYEVNALKPHEVAIQVSHCGICHSDIHLIDDDWGMSEYPLVPGHEVVGTIAKMGSDVTHLQLGQRVGVGWEAGSCLTCEWCCRGYENLCAQAQPTAVKHHGGFADGVVVDSRFAFALPDALDSVNAAPLLCGGITVYTPLRYYNITPNMKVGVIGIGGLGHLALQFAHHYGCEVTAFSTTPEKEAEARKFGAHHFVSTHDHRELDDHQNSLDFIISTVFNDIDWTRYLNILRPNGKLCVLGAAESDIQIPALPLIAGRRGIVGSCIGGRADIEEMLAFAARHQIQAQTEVMPLSEVNAALDHVRKNKARYRLVLEV